MKYLKFLFNKTKKFVKGLIIQLIPYLFILFFVLLSMWGDGYTLEDFGVTLNPFDYCTLTDVEYSAILHDDINKKANVEITEYLTFDVHAASKSNPFKELWRELPEEYVDGLKVTYDVKSVTQILEDGTEIPYTETSKMYWEDYDYTEANTYRWHHSSGDGRYPDNDESVLIYIPWTYRDKMTFKIVYSMNNAALKYADCSELYLSMYSGNTITKLNSFKGEILIPNKLMPSNYHAYTFGTSKSRIPFKESPSTNPGYYTFSFNLDKSDLRFNYHNRYIEFCLLAYGKDKHIFTKNAPNNYYSHENVLQECIDENTYYETENTYYGICKLLLLLTSICLSFYVVYHTKRKYKKIIEKYTFNEPEVDFEYFREIPSDLDPIFASELVFMKDPFNENREKKEEYAAILLSLARKKYVTLEKIDPLKDWDNINTLITVEERTLDYTIEDFSKTTYYNLERVYKIINKRTGEILEPLTTSERLYLELLERHSRATNHKITLTLLQTKINTDYDYTNNFVTDIENKPALEGGVMQGYFQDTDYNAPQKTLNLEAKTNFIISMFLLIFANFASYLSPLSLAFGAYTILGATYVWSYFYLTSKASNAVLFTQYGANEQAKWYGLYNFLNSDTLINEKQVHELPLWEKYLIYATAFGISEKVIKAIKINAVNINTNNSLILNNSSFVHSTRFHTTSRSFGRSLHTSSRGGGFGGHGYGGGGRGGGGGGGGH